MPLTRIAGWVLIALMLSGGGTVFSQTYPSKPVRIVTAPVGGGVDTIARLIAPGITAALGQPVLIDNRPQNLIGEIVARAPPDGYTLLFTGGSFWLAPFLDKTPYDPVADFAPITLAVSSPDALVVHPSLPVRTVKDLIALAKARPGELNYASGPSGSSQHLEGELFKSLAGVNIVRVVYAGNGPSITALMGGEVQMNFVGLNVVVPHLQSGRLRALAIASAQPSVRFPDLPTVAASLPGFEPVFVNAIFAPAKTPAAIITRLNQEIVRALNQPDVKEKLPNGDIVGSTPEQAMATMKADMARMGKLIKDIGIRAE